MDVRAFVVLVALSSLAFAEAYPPAATNTFKSVSLKLHDAVRNKDVPVRVTYPTNSDKVPLIVFSHGAGGSGDGYTGLTEYWAEHGYICLQPTHADSMQQQKEEGKNATLFGAMWDASVNPEAWVNRTKDIVLVLDSIDEIEKRVPAIKGRIDRSRIGVSGHAFGAFTSQAVAGALIKLPGEAEPKSFRDRRVKAVLLLSPQGAGKTGLVETSWKDFKLPMMVMTGSRDYGDLGTLGKEKRGPEWRTEPYRYAPVGDKYLIFISNASHMSFTGLPAADTGLLAKKSAQRGIDEKAIFEWIRIGSLAFWDDYLKQEKSAKNYLETDELAKTANGQVKVDRK